MTLADACLSTNPREADQADIEACSGRRCSDDGPARGGHGGEQPDVHGSPRPRPAHRDPVGQAVLLRRVPGLGRAPAPGHPRARPHLPRAGAHHRGPRDAGAGGRRGRRRPPHRALGGVRARRRRAARGRAAPPRARARRRRGRRRRPRRAAVGRGAPAGGPLRRGAHPRRRRGTTATASPRPPGPAPPARAGAPRRRRRRRDRRLDRRPTAPSTPPTPRCCASSPARPRPRCRTRALHQRTDARSTARPAARPTTSRRATSSSSAPATR